MVPQVFGVGCYMRSTQERRWEVGQWKQNIERGQKWRKQKCHYEKISVSENIQKYLCEIGSVNKRKSGIACVNEHNWGFKNIGGGTAATQS